MITSWRGPAALLTGFAATFVLVANTAGAAVPARVAALGGQGTPVNACANPVVDRDLTGWGRHAGGTTALARVAVDTHVVASSGAWLNNNTANPAMYLPQKLVEPGGQWTVGLDSWVDRGGASPMVRIDVDWYNSAGTYLGHVAGTPRPVPSTATQTWTRSASDFTAPSNAARMNPTATLIAPADVSWIATGCDIRPTTGTGTQPPTTVPPTTVPPTTVPPTTVPPTTTPPPAGAKCQTTAASTFGWGTPRFVDNFDRTTMGPNWGLYEGEGHNGNGTRSPAAFTVDGDVATITGTSGGRSGGAALDGQVLYRDRIETCMRAPAGDGDYHPVLLLWPDAEDWPVGGEVDYAEIFRADRQEVNFFLHYGASNSQTHAARTVNATQWRSYAVEWTASCMIGYVDAAEFFRDCSTSHLPPRNMHATMQLDAFGGDGGYTQSIMQVDSLKIWDGN
jgi:hypothetical protein